MVKFVYDRAANSIQENQGIRKGRILCNQIDEDEKNGMPDLIALKDGDILFSEVKKPNGRLSRLQEYRLKELEGYGFRTEVFRG